MTFDAIYRTNAWKGSESRSGPGSGTAPTRPLLRAIDLVERAIQPNTVLNIACGDDFWTPELPGYLGVDIVPAAIERARKRHPSRHYELADGRDLARYGLFDLAICRDAIQHLPLADGRRMIEEARRHSRWTLLSTYVLTENQDIAEGDFFSPNLTAEPFELEQPELLFFDGWDWKNGTAARDPHKYLGLWRNDHAN
jgi:hypothetical protein